MRFRKPEFSVRLESGTWIKAKDFEEALELVLNAMSDGMEATIKYGVPDDLITLHVEV